mmetsp:Transcript_506/g.576  ORF Transcript_506/g.576 Transcript_506/m.576 type:complete len:850 (-) Transcript_506:158-2707(-)
MSSDERLDHLQEDKDDDIVADSPEDSQKQDSEAPEAVEEVARPETDASGENSDLDMDTGNASDVSKPNDNDTSNKGMEKPDSEVLAGNDSNVNEKSPSQVEDEKDSEVPSKSEPMDVHEVQENKDSQKESVEEPLHNDQPEKETTEATADKEGSTQKTEVKVKDEEVNEEKREEQGEEKDIDVDMDDKDDKDGDNDGDKDDGKDDKGGDKDDDKDDEKEDEGDDDEDDDDNAQDAENQTPINQTHAIILPSYASWFNMSKIHKIEKESLPEFFDTTHPSKSPKIYINYRNFMINSYRLNPNEYLTLTSCRRNLVGDVGTLMRVHRFLNKWGLINYQVDPNFKPGYALEKLPNGSQIGLPYTGNFHVTYDTPRGLFPFDTHKFNGDRLDIQRLKKLLNLEQAPDQSINNDNMSSGETKNVDDLDKSSSEPPQKKRKSNSDSWTDKEISKLILGVKDFPNDWYKISKSVSTKTPQECILKFLKLPIEDDFNNLTDKELGFLKYSSNFPISSVDNPVISNLAFMTQLVDSDVARAASERACKVMDIKALEKIRKIYGEADQPKDGVKQENKPEESDDGKVTDGLENKQGGVDKSSPRKDVDTEMSIDDDKKEEKNSSVDDNKQNEEVKSNGTNEKNGNANDVSPKPQTDTELIDEYKNGDTDPLQIIKDASSNTFGIVGARSHLFANYEERELNKLTNTIVNNQISKLDLKLKKVDELERIYEKERKHLAKQQEEVFIDRLALTKSTIHITKKLNDAISMIQQKTQDIGELSDVSSILSDVQSLLYKPNRHSLIQSTVEKQPNDTSDKPNNNSGEDTENGNINSNSTADNRDTNIVKPLSLDTPLSFKVWVP